ncbi:hypothetical protein IAU60_002914 [Kwoniella sp. DSM 27419]
MKANPAVMRRKAVNASPNLVPFAVTFAHVLLAPYTKVEESFTLHAVHDVLAYGPRATSLPLCDHVTFPGALPRSFLPPVLLGLLSYPLSAAGVASGLVRSKLDVQVLVRLVLAALFSHTFNHLCKTVRMRFGPEVRFWFTLLSLTSFHIPFYAGRTLPNFVALPGVLLSTSLLLRAGSKTSPPIVNVKRTRNAVLLFTALATVVRLELALFLLPTALSLVLIRRASLAQVIAWGSLGGFGSLAISAPLDYLLWRPTIPHPSLPTFTSPLQIIWPELSAMHFNALQGNSAEWGVMPFHYYFTNSLPKLLLSSSLLLPVGLGVWFLRSAGARAGGKAGAKVEEGVGEVLRLFGLGIATLLGAMSCIGHKEWRFIIYALPILQLIAALAAAGLWSFPYPRLRPLVRLGLFGLVGVNLASTAVMTFLSVHNYPGGEVWKALERLPGVQERSITVHFPSYPLQTGATLFTFLHQASPLDASAWPNPALPAHQTPAWIYSKSEAEEYATPATLRETQVDYVVTEDWQSYVEGGWDVIDEITGLDGVGRDGKYGVTVKWGRKLGILGRGQA